MKHHHHHLKKPKPVSFKSFIGGTNTLIKSAVAPQLALIKAGESGIKGIGKGISSASSSLIVPLIIGGGLVLVFYVSQKR